jgi:hypothetical protein
MRYFCTVCVSRCRAPARKQVLIALSNGAMGGFQKLWWGNLTLLALVVCAYEKPVVLTRGLWRAGPTQRGRVVVGLFWWCSCLTSHMLMAVPELLHG